MTNLNSYIEQKQAQLDEWKAEVDRLQTKATKATADMRQQMNAKIDDLNKALGQGKAKLEHLAKASDQSRESLEKTIDAAWTDLRTEVKAATERFSEAVGASSH